MKTIKLPEREIDVSVLCAQWRAIRDQANAALAMLGDQDLPTPPANRNEEEPRWMRIKTYRLSRSIPERTMAALLREGLPVVGEGKNRRVVVAAADECFTRRGLPSAFSLRAPRCR